MKLLTFQAHFWWKSFSKTLEDVPTLETEEKVSDAVVLFLHAEEKDEDPDERKRVFKHTLKHVKWVANKRELRNVVLHSFTHLASSSASPEYAQAFLEELAERLRGTDYQVSLTPFGYFCEWELNVFGESMAKVWKEV